MTIPSLTTLSTGRAARALLLAAALVLAASVANAQTKKEYDPNMLDLSRDADSFVAEVRPDVVRPVTADTVLTFTNTSRRKNVVGCTAFDGNGDRAGASRVELPPHGLRLLRFSDLTDRRPVIGSVVCKALEPVRAVAVFVGPGFSDLPTHHNRHGDLTSVRVPLAATY